MRRSLIDCFAAELARKIGAEVKVHRGRAGHRPIYQISIVREEHVVLLQGNGAMGVNEAKRTLAMLNDLVGQGFILTMPSDATLDETISLTRNWQAVRTALVLMDA